jgi:hypothetical protein
VRTGARTLVGASVAVGMAVIGSFLVLSAPVTAHPDPPHSTTSSSTTSSSTTSSSTTSTTTSQPPAEAPPPTTTTPKVEAATAENPFFQQAPSSLGETTTGVQPRADEPVTTTTGPVAGTNTMTAAPGRFRRTGGRIVVTGVILPAPEPVLGPAGTFARAYGITGGLAGVVAVEGTETIDYTTLTFAQLSGRGSFVGSLRSVGDETLTFVTTIPRSTSFAGEASATESGRITGLSGWRGTISMRYVATAHGNSLGTYRAVFARTHR